MAKDGPAGPAPAARSVSGPAPMGVVNLGDMEKQLDQTGADGSVRPPPPTYREQVVVKLATWVGAAIVALTLLLIVEWVWHAPPAPPAADLRGGAPNLVANADAARQLVDNDQTLSDVAADRSIKVFNSFVGKAFLPVFTTLIGYIIGARSAKDA